MRSSAVPQKKVSQMIEQQQMFFLHRTVPEKLRVHAQVIPCSEQPVLVAVPDKLTRSLIGSVHICHS